MPAYPRNARWHYRSLQSGHQFHHSIWLYPEPSGAPMADELDDDATSDDVFAAYVRYCHNHYSAEWGADAIPVMWSAQASHTSEFAPFQGYPEDWLSFLSWPTDDEGERMDWFRLPVVTNRFAALYGALDYPFAPFQKAIPLRSMWASRRGTPRE